MITIIPFIHHSIFQNILGGDLTVSVHRG
jgi:hypothetical protein